MTAALLAAASRAICPGRAIATNGRVVQTLPRYASPWPGRWVRVGEVIDEAEAAQILGRLEQLGRNPSQLEAR